MPQGSGDELTFIAAIVLVLLLSLCAGSRRLRCPQFDLPQGCQIRGERLRIGK
jgi:hypothetical protein